MQPGAEHTEDAYNAALLVAGFIRDVHLIRVSAVQIKNGDPVDDG